MQDFEMDYTEDVVNYEAAEPGPYELQISDAVLKKSDTGKEYIALTVTIRDDVEQGYAGTKMWDNIWKNEVYRNPQLKNKRIKKDDYDALSPEQKQNIIVRQEFDDYKIRTLVHAQDCDEVILDANGVKVPNPQFQTKFSNIEEVVLFLNGLCFQANVKKFTDDKTGKEKNSFDYKTVKRTSVSPQTSVDVDDSDLPF